MNTLLRFLSLVLCLELILGPLGHSLVLSQKSWAETCPTGQTFSTALNSCVLKTQVVEANRSVEECMKLEGEEQRKCYARNATDPINGVGDRNHGLVDDQGRTQGMGHAATAAAVAVPLFMLTLTALKAKKQQVRCRPASLLLMYGGALALGAGEVISYINHKSNIKKNEELWAQITLGDANANSDKKREQATEAQSQAFEMLAKNEDSIRSVARTKHGFYLASTSLFAAGALMGTIEQIRLMAANAKLAVTPQDLNALDTKNKLECKFNKQESEKAHEEEKNKKEAEEKKKIEEEENRLLEERRKNNPEIEPMKRIETPTLEINRPQPPIQQRPMPKPASPAGGGTSKIENNLHTPNSIDYNKYNIKRMAANNIKNATTLDELIPLIEEFESIEFENYSRLDYGQNDVPKSQLPTSAGQVISQILISEAFADSMGPFIPEEEESTGEVGPKAKIKIVTSGTSGTQKITVGKNTTVVDTIEKIEKEVKNVDGKPNLKKVKDIIKNIGDKLFEFIQRPYTRIGLNALFGTWTGIMTSHLKKLERDSKDRAEKLRSIAEDFKSNLGILHCKEEDRSNPAKPECYCYTPDNKKNPQRANSKICNGIWGTTTARSDSYLGFESEKVCVNQGMQVDPACSCKRNGSCMKVSAAMNMNGINPGYFRMLSAGTGPANDLFNGNAAAGSINSGAGTNAARIKKAQEDLLKKTDPKAAKEISKLEKQMASGLTAMTSGLSMGGPGAGSSSMPSNPQAAVKALEKELKEASQDLSVSEAGGGGGMASADGEAQFDLTGGEAGVEEQVAEVMKEDMDFGANDINSGSTTNIFEVLSNRYQRSAMRRLFDEEGKTQADSPAKKEIND